MKRILILGASLLQVPAIIKAKELGYYVGVVDYDASAPGIQYADEYYNVSTNDIAHVVELAKRFRANGVTTLATDLPVRTVAAVCEELGLPGISLETAIRATDKGEMIKAFAAHSVAHPWFIICESIYDPDLSYIEYPCIVKPTDNSGSRGVILVNSKHEIRDALEYSRQRSRSGRVIIEEYLQGHEVSVEIFVRNGIPHVIAVTDKITTGPPHFVEMGHSQPSRLGTDDISRVSDLAVRAVRAVGIHSGPAHVEVMLTDTGPVMIELGARLGGDFIATHLVPLSTGVDLVAATIHEACGDSYSIEPRFQQGSAVRYLTAQSSGTIRSIDGVREALRIPGIQEVILMKRIGETVGKPMSSNDRIGVVIAESADALGAENACRAAIECIGIETC